MVVIVYTPGFVPVEDRNKLSRQGGRTDWLLKLKWQTLF